MNIFKEKIKYVIAFPTEEAFTVYHLIMHDAWQIMPPQ